MGDYAGVATRIKVSKHAPKEVIDFLDELYCFKDEESESPTHEAMQRIQSMLIGGSAYFDAWHWRMTEDTGEKYWLYQSRASSKRVDLKLFVTLFETIKEHLLHEDGDILVRTMGYDSTREQVVYLTNGEFKIREGFNQYECDHGFVTDSRHPRYFKTPKDVQAKLASGEMTREQRLTEDDFEPPWTIAELDKAIAEETAEKKKNRPHGYGF